MTRQRYLACTGLLGLLVSSSSCDDAKQPDQAQKPADASDVENKAETKSKPGIEFFEGDKPTFPGAASALSFDMSKADAQAKAPKAFESKVEGFEDVKLTLSFEKLDRLYSVYVKLKTPGDAVEKALTEKWGEPRKVEKGGKPNLYWTNLDAGVRARLETHAGTLIYFEPVTSTAAVFGSGDEKGKLAFEKMPLLGASVDEVKAAYANQINAEKPDSLTLKISALDVSSGPGYASLKIADGKVSEWQLRTNYEWAPETEAKILAILEKAYGAPNGKDGLYVDFPGPPAVKVQGSPDSMTIFFKNG